MSFSKALLSVFHHSFDRELKSHFKGNLLIIKQHFRVVGVDKSEQWKLFLSSACSSSVTSLPGTEEAVCSWHMTHTNAPPSHNLAYASQPPVFPSVSSARKQADREAEITLYEEVCDVLRGCRGKVGKNRIFTSWFIIAKAGKSGEIVKR